MPENRSWNLETFLDSLIVELDKAQDTLALKGINQPLTYTVKDLALELQLFPVFTGDQILFSTARPGESGASKVNIQLGSITDRQIREITKAPVRKDDVTVDMIDVDDDTRKTLRKIGVRSVKDIEKMEEKQVDIRKAATGRVDYRKLADAIQRAQRGKARPEVKELSARPAADSGVVLSFTGANLAIEMEDPDFPIALFNGKRVRVLSASPNGIEVKVDRADIHPGSNQMAVAFDRYTIVRMDVRS